MSSNKDIIACGDKFASIEEKLASIDRRLESIVEIQYKQANIHVEQAADIKHHISRTDALEKIVLNLNDNRLQWMGAAKFIAILASMGGAYTLFRLIAAAIH